MQARWFLHAQNRVAFCLQVIFLTQLKMSFKVSCLDFHLVIATNELYFLLDSVMRIQIAVAIVVDLMAKCTLDLNAAIMLDYLDYFQN